MASQEDESLSENEGVYWKHKHNALKGNYMEAKAEMKRGACIIEELPLFQFTYERYDLFDENVFYGPGPHSGGPAVLKKFKELSLADQGRYRQLCYDDKKTHEWLEAQAQDLGRKRGPLTMEQWQCLSRCQRNAFDLSSGEAVESGDGEKLIVVFHRISFFNHSCKPNAVLKWDPVRRCGMVHALREIKQKDEIRLNYMRDNWHFDCKCTLCIRGATLSDAMDQKRSAAWRDWKILRKMRFPTDDDALELAQDIPTWPDGHRDVTMDNEGRETVDVPCKQKAVHKEHRRILAYFQSVVNQFKALGIDDTSV